MNQTAFECVDSLYQDSAKVDNEAIDKSNDFVAKHNNDQLTGDQKDPRHLINQHDFLQRTEIKNEDYQSKWASSQKKIGEESEEKPLEVSEVSW